MTNGKSGITDKQLELISVFEHKEKLTEKQLEKLNEMRYKRDNPELSQTAKTYLHEIYIEEVYGRSKDISNKYTEKGLYVEEDSLNLMCKKYNTLLIKNKQSFDNEFIKGTPDVIIKDQKVLDAKSSWDIWTFSEADGTNSMYFWQGQGYMYLTGLKKFDLAYCLNNAPEHLIVSEKQKAFYNEGLKEGSPELVEMEDTIDKNMKFDDIPEDERIKVFSFEFEPEAIKKLQKRIVECRNYLNSITNL
jgi:hypothetical protein